MQNAGYATRVLRGGIRLDFHQLACSVLTKETFKLYAKIRWLIHFDQFRESLYFFSFALAAIGLWAWATRTFHQKKVSASGVFRIEYYRVLVTLIVILLNALGVLVLRGWIGVAVFNIFYETAKLSICEPPPLIRGICSEVTMSA